MVGDLKEEKKKEERDSGCLCPTCSFLFEKKSITLPILRAHREGEKKKRRKRGEPGCDHFVVCYPSMSPGFAKQSKERRGRGGGGGGRGRGGGVKGGRGGGGGKEGDLPNLNPFSSPSYTLYLYNAEGWGRFIRELLVGTRSHLSYVIDGVPGEGRKSPPVYLTLDIDCNERKKGRKGRKGGRGRKLLESLPAVTFS